MTNYIFTNTNPKFTTQKLTFQLQNNQTSILFTTIKNKKTTFKTTHTYNLTINNIFLINSNPYHNNSSPNNKP